MASGLYPNLNEPWSDVEDVGGEGGGEEEETPEVAAGLYARGRTEHSSVKLRSRHSRSNYGDSHWQQPPDSRQQPTHEVQHRLSNSVNLSEFERLEFPSSYAYSYSRLPGSDGPTNADGDDGRRRNRTNADGDDDGRRRDHTKWSVNGDTPCSREIPEKMKKQWRHGARELVSRGMQWLVKAELWKKAIVGSVLGLLFAVLCSELHLGKPSNGEYLYCCTLK